MLIWVFTALVISTIDSRSAKNTAAESLKTVTTLAITAQQAHTDETLSLIRRGDETVRKQSYYQRIDTMQQELSEYLGRDDAIDKGDLADAEQLLRRWRAADDRHRFLTSRLATTRPRRRSRWAAARTTRHLRSTRSTKRWARASTRAANSCAATSSTLAACCPARPSGRPYCPSWQ